MWRKNITSNRPFHSAWTSLTFIESPHTPSDGGEQAAPPSAWACCSPSPPHTTLCLPHACPPLPSYMPPLQSHTCVCTVHGYMRPLQIRHRLLHFDEKRSACEYRRTESMSNTVTDNTRLVILCHTSSHHTNWSCCLSHVFIFLHFHHSIDINILSPPCVPCVVFTRQ